MENNCVVCIESISIKSLS